MLEDASKAEVAASEVNKVVFPYFGGIDTPNFPSNKQGDVLLRNVPMQRLTIQKDGQSGAVWVATVFDLQVASYGVFRGLKNAQGQLVDDGAKSYDDNVPYTPLGKSRSPVPLASRCSPWLASSPTTPTRPTVVHGHHRCCDEPLVPLRHELSRHHQHADDVRLRRAVRWRWAHYVGQEKLRPQTGWTPLAFAADWVRPASAKLHQLLLRPHRSMALRKAGVSDEVLSPLARTRPSSVAA